MKQLIIINFIVLVMISLVGCSVKNKSQEETKSEKEVKTESTVNTEVDQETEVETEQTIESETTELNVESETQEGSNNKSISENELLFVFKNDVSNEGVIKLLGEPESTSDAEVWGADGLEHQTWFYNENGIEIDIVTEENKKKVNSLKVTMGNIKTSKNIGIGSSKEYVIDAYKNEINNDVDSQENQIVVGSVYDGIHFQLENDKVISFYIGASAE